MSLPYIGAKISLISKSEVRYEGTLYKINTQESTVALQNVKVFGTEGRRMDGPQIPANDTLFEFVIFRGADIKDLEVCEAAPTQSTVFEDPAIVSATPAAPQNTANPPKPPPQEVESNNVAQRYRSSDGHGQRQDEERPSNYRRGAGQGNYRGSRGRGSAPGTGTHLLSKRTRNVGDQAPDESGDFDFSSMNEKFDKETELAKLSLDDDNADFSGEGSSASFFDNISCDITDRSAGKPTRLFGAEERELNKETFGAIGLSYGGRYPRRGRGRGGRGGTAPPHRGGRGGQGPYVPRGSYRGAPRGGYRGGRGGGQEGYGNINYSKPFGRPENREAPKSYAAASAGNGGAAST